MLRLGRRQPRALGRERGLSPEAGSAGGLSPWAKGGGHTLPCLGATPCPVWGLCPSQPGESPCRVETPPRAAWEEGSGEKGEGDS